MRTTYKLISVMIAAVFVLSAASMAFSDNGTEKYDHNYALGSGLVPVSDITGIPISTPVGTLDLSSVAVVMPNNATNTDIKWAVKTAGSTNASISGSTLTTTASGNVTLTAKIENGAPAGWAMVAAGWDHSVAIAGDGTLWEWGSNIYGGVSGSGTYQRIPVQISNDNDWVMVSAGQYISAAIRDDGSLWTWGANGYSQLGNGTTSSTPTKIPAKIGSETDFWVTVSVGFSYMVAIKDDGTMWAWGNNYNGQLGVGDAVRRDVPTKIGTDENWASVSAGWNHTIALKDDGTMWTWGYNGNGELGNGSSGAVSIFNPTKISDDVWIEVSAAQYHSAAIKEDGSLWTWGSGQYSRLGTGTGNVDIPTPILSSAGGDWASVYAGQYDTFAIKKNGELWGWGFNNNGQLGLGSLSEVSIPHRIGSSSDWIQVSCSSTSMLALKTDNTLWGAGHNNTGQLGIGGTASSANVLTEVVSTLQKDYVKEFTIAVIVPPTVTTVSLQDGTVGGLYAQQLEVTGTEPMSWAIASGSLPDGLTLTPSDGLIWGTPTVAGTFTFTVKASNPLEGTKTLSITINQVPAPPVIMTSSLSDGTTGTPYSQTLTATGDAAMSWAVHSGGLPDGLTLSSAGGISGTPTAGGTFVFAVKATNGAGYDIGVLSITIGVPPEIAISALKAPGELPDAVVNNEYSVTLTASGDGTVTWTIESGELPAGLTLSADGTISGTPTEEGLFSVVLKAENTYGNDTVALTMLVEPEPITDIEIAEPAADLGTWGAVIAMAVLLVVISVSMAMRPKK